MSTDQSESLKFYHYLCQKIGSEEVVRIRRLTSTITDIGRANNYIFTSGSKGEGLDLKGSDLDLMSIDPSMIVYESEKDIARNRRRNISVIMNTEDTQPCFTQLYLPNHLHDVVSILCNNDSTKLFQKMFHKHHLGYALSNESFKLLVLSRKDLPVSRVSKIHGPCLSDIFDLLDFAHCLKCDKWIFQAKPWVSRPRTTWPSPELISKIISCGVLFVPIGCKGSLNEHLEWRISFSVAEKFLIFSFSHTQFLCYAMLKILLKEIVERHENLKALLCSYFLKTLMFWISEETDSCKWRPNNIIPCFMACLQRLLYCVRYSILSHYFIPDNNLLYLRFNVINNENLTTVLNNLLKKGIKGFAFSDTLQDYQSFRINESFHGYTKQQIMPTFFYFPIENIKSLLHHFLHHSKTGLSRDLFALYLSAASSFAQQNSKYPISSENKIKYLRYKKGLSHLLISLNFDAVFGWLMLASFFYVNKKYLASLHVIHYALQKYTKEKIYTESLSLNQTNSHIQNNVLDLMKNEKLYTVLKALIIYPLQFSRKSSIIPQELQLDVSNYYTAFHPLTFAYFLNFLCYYHLHDITSCGYSLQQLQHAQSITTDFGTKISIPDSLNSFVLCGIAHQLMGETYLARQQFQLATRIDKFNVSTAVARLSSLI